VSERRRKTPPPGTARRIEVPDRKISETILDFGEPLLSRFDERTPIDVFRRALGIVIAIWNAHVMAMPIWGEPHHLEDLEAVLRKHPEPPGEPPILESLAKRRVEMFADDPRAVGLWDVVPDARYGLKLRCDARLPRGVEPLRRRRAGDA
jgi:hypothetical protein